jgi:hypothetical protein
MRKGTWLFKSFGTHTPLVLDPAKEKLHGMPIFLAKGAMEHQFGSMSSKAMKSTLAIRITLGNTRRSNNLRSSYGRAIKALAHLPQSEDSRSREEVDSGLEEANLEASTSE